MAIVKPQKAGAWRVSAANDQHARLKSDTTHITVFSTDPIAFWIWFPELRNTVKEVTAEYRQIVERCRFAVRAAHPPRFVPPWAMTFTHFLHDKRGKLSTIGIAAERPISEAIKLEGLIEDTRLSFIQSITHNFVFSKTSVGPMGVLLAVGDYVR